MPLMMSAHTNRDAPVLDRLIRVRFADPGRYNDWGEYQKETRVETMWAARVDIDVDLRQGHGGVIEVGGAVYLIRWLDVVFDREAEYGRPAIVELADSVGWRNVIGIETPTGYRGRYLEIHCAGTK